MSRQSSWQVRRPVLDSALGHKLALLKWQRARGIVASVFREPDILDLSDTGGTENDMLRLSIRNANRPGSPTLTSRECVQVFEKGFRKRSLTGCHHSSHFGCAWPGSLVLSQDEPGSLVSDVHPMSASSPCRNGLGLSSVKMALACIGGQAYMSSNAEYTTVHLLLPTAKHAQDQAHAAANVDQLVRSRNPADMTVVARKVASPSLDKDQVESEPSSSLAREVLRACMKSGQPLLCMGIDAWAACHKMQVSAHRCQGFLAPALCLFGVAQSSPEPQGQRCFCVSQSVFDVGRAVCR